MSLTMKIHYLDNASTAPVLPSAAAAALKAMTENFGNPSSLHALGFEAERAVEESRAAIAAAIGVPKGEVYFTSGGTVSNNLALTGAARACVRRGKHILISAIEHESSVMTGRALAAEGFSVDFVRPRADGVVDAGELIAALRPDTSLVSLMLVNNETGLSQPVAEVGRALKGRGVILHTDAVQAFMKRPLSAAALGADMMSLSGHKIGAPKGVGALWIKKGTRFAPPLHGAQQSSVFPGTESVPLIAAFGAAVAERRDKIAENAAAVAALKREFLSRYAGEVISEGGESGIVLLSMPGYKGETVVHFLAERGVYVSSGSACGKGRPSHVLEAMGLPSGSAIRVSFSAENTLEDVEALLSALTDAAALRHS